MSVHPLRGFGGSGRGEIRAVRGIEQRLKELHRLGFQHRIVPRSNVQGNEPFRFTVWYDSRGSRNRSEEEKVSACAMMN